MQGTAKFKAATGRFMTPKSLFDPSWQAGGTAAQSAQMPANRLDEALSPGSALTGGMSTVDSIATSRKLPAANRGSGLLSRSTSAMSSLNNTSSTLTGSSVPTPAMDGPRTSGGGLLSRTGKFPLVGTGNTSQFAAIPTNRSVAETESMTDFNTPGELTAQTRSDSARLTGSMKTVKASGRLSAKIPVAPQEDSINTPGAMDEAFPIAPDWTRPAQRRLKPWIIIALVLLVVILLVGATGGVFWFLRGRTTPATTNNHPQPTATQTVGTPDPKAAAQAAATATAQANIILSDPLDQNMHNWLTSPPDVYAFKNGAYHITDRGDNGRATVLQASPVAGPLGYTLTMEQVQGQTSDTNSFGMLFRFGQKTQGGKTITTFYSFEVVNNKGGQYQFWLYNDGDAKATSPWKKIWSQPFGNEFHQGLGDNATNTIKIFMDGNKFSFTVNGKMVKTVQDGTLQSGQVGMIVNQNGTEVAFKNLLLTRS